MILDVFYDERMVAEAQGVSPSAEKPRWVVKDWERLAGLSVRRRAVEPASLEQLCLAHDEKFVSAVLNLKQENGFGNRSASVAAALPWTNGAMISAAKSVVVEGGWACAPVSGFHHAEWSESMGFCTFNGLIMAARVCQKELGCNVIAILDCDAHWGNGTQQIKDFLGLNWLDHWSFGELFRTKSDCAGGRFERWLERAVLACSKADLVLYQAGADPHVSDPFGGMLTTEQMRWRDNYVAEHLKGKPMAWCLAGGYQVVEGKEMPEKIEPVLALHRMSARIFAQKNKSQ